MPEEMTMGHVDFDPPLKPGSEEYTRAWEILAEMMLIRKVVFSFVGVGYIRRLNFDTRDEAMMFRLRL